VSGGGSRAHTRKLTVAIPARLVEGAQEDARGEGRIHNSATGHPGGGNMESSQMSTAIFQGKIGKQ
jgi:hypothetical protein